MRTFEHACVCLFSLKPYQKMFHPKITAGCWWKTSSFLMIIAPHTNKSIACWYGLGGDWIHVGLPMHVDIDSKPESGCEIQSARCGKSGIMICLKLVKSKSCWECKQTGNFDENEGTKVWKELTLPWAKTNCLLVADSFLLPCRHAGMQSFFTGVVKTTTRNFQMQHLQSKQITKQGQHHGVFHYAVSPREPN